MNLRVILNSWIGLFISPATVLLAETIAVLSWARPTTAATSRSTVAAKAAAMRSPGRSLALNHRRNCERFSVYRSTTRARSSNSLLVQSCCPKKPPEPLGVSHFQIRCYTTTRLLNGILVAVDKASVTAGVNEKGAMRIQRYLLTAAVISFSLGIGLSGCSDGSSTRSGTTTGSGSATGSGSGSVSGSGSATGSGTTTGSGTSTSGSSSSDDTAKTGTKTKTGSGTKSGGSGSGSGGGDGY
jgi:hypothetical protein